MHQILMNFDDAVAYIEAGKTLLIAGDESLLEKLPKGNWIAGTIPYFTSPEEGGLESSDKIFVTDISYATKSISIKDYTSDTIDLIYKEGGEGGLSFIIIPGLSQTHISFALKAPNFENFGSQPLVGWISGINLNDMGKAKPKVYNGNTGKKSEDEALVMHVELIEGKSVDVGIINLFEQGNGDTLTFPETTFSTETVMVNGREQNFAEYIQKNNLDPRLPLVADYYGALINISFQNVSLEKGVDFYAPVFSGVEYKLASPVIDYSKSFDLHLKENEMTGKQILFSCNCILNYVYSELEGKKTEPFVGPFTFGEIAYQLLNQTLIYVDISDI